MNELELITEALAVRDDGQEPKHTAGDYDLALLFVARREQGVAEDMPTALARVVATDDDADALIFTADRVRAAEAALGKSAVTEDAERVAKSNAAPRFTRDQYHDEMLRISKAAARSGEGVAGAFSRLCGEGAFDELYAAGEQAEAAEVEAVLAKAAPDDRFYPILMDLASMRKRQGETIEAACSRLLHEDATVRDAYAATQGM